MRACNAGLVQCSWTVSRLWELFAKVKGPEGNHCQRMSDRELADYEASQSARLYYQERRKAAP